MNLVQSLLGGYSTLKTNAARACFQSRLGVKEGKEEAIRSVLDYCDGFEE